MLHRLLGTLLYNLLLWTALMAGIAVLYPSVCSAQSAGSGQMLSSYIGQPVSTVEIAGQPDQTLASVQRFITVKPGQPLAKNDVIATINALKQQGGFSDVGLDLEPDANGVRVIFVLKPAIYVGMYQFPGATKVFSYSRLLQVSNYPTQAPYSASDVQQAETSLVKFFRQTGYFTAEVHSEVATDSTHNLANVIFNTTLGRKAKIGKISLQGDSPEETAYLNKKLRSLMARLRGDSLKPGMTYSNSRIQSATQYMQSVLTSRKYLAGSVQLLSANYDPTTNRADIIFNVTTGPVVEVKTVGAHLGSRTLRNLVPMYAANAVDTELINEGGRNIQLYFQKKGYFDTQVQTSVADTSAGKLITYEIHKNARSKLQELSFDGNRHFGSKELASRVSVKEAHLFSRGTYTQKLARDSAKNIQNTYRSAGYSKATVTPRVVRKGNDLAITFQVNEGPLDIVQDLRIEGNNTLPENDLAPRGLKLGPGKPYSQTLVNEDRNQIIARYLTLGYLNAAFISTARPLKSDPHRLQVVYKISEGPQVKVADIVTVGRQHTRQSLINRELEMKPQQPLSENGMMSAETRLYNLGIFDWAELDPKRPITDQNNEDVIVKVHESKRNSIVYGFGFEVINRGGSVPSGTVAVPGIPPIGLPKGFKTSQKTFWGPRGTFEYTRRNVRGRAESYTISAFAGRLDQRAGFTFTDPYFRGTKWSGSAITSFERNEQNPIFTARLGNIGYQLQRALDAKKTSNLFLRYNLQITRISNLLIPDLVPANQHSVRLSTLSATYIHDTRDNILDAHRGLYESFELSINPSFLGSNFSFARFLGQAAYYRNIGHGIVWASSLRLGLEQAYGGSEVPLSQRFFSGGGSTLRGFPLNGAGPQRTIAACGNPNDKSTCVKITVPNGGNELLILNTEMRVPLDVVKKNLGVVAFYDGGNVFPIIGFHNFGSLYTNSVGLGLRYATPVGPVRIDLGHNLNPIPGVKSTQYFITIGQAF